MRKPGAYESLFADLETRGRMVLLESGSGRRPGMSRVGAPTDAAIISKEGPPVRSKEGPPVRPCIMSCLAATPLMPALDKVCRKEKRGC